MRWSSQAQVLRTEADSAEAFMECTSSLRVSQFHGFEQIDWRPAIPFDARLSRWRRCVLGSVLRLVPVKNNAVYNGVAIAGRIGTAQQHTRGEYKGVIPAMTP